MVKKLGLRFTTNHSLAQKKNSNNSRGLKLDK